MSVCTESVPCNQCGSSDTDIVAQGADREYYTSSDVFTIVQCRHCQLIYLNPRPVARELGRIYPPTYHSYILDEAVGSKGSFITRMRQKAGATRFRPILKHLRSHYKIDVLDVGCGNGWMMRVFKSLDARIDTFGIEISDEVCEAARALGHTVYCGRFEDVELDRQFDVINLTHVIEHVSDPRLVMRKAREALRPGGLLVLETPNIGSFEWRLFRAGTWGAYHIPRHWYFFNRDTIRVLGESERLEFLDWYCHPGPTHWVWTLHNLCLARDDWFGSLGRRIFDPVRIFRGGLTPTLVHGYIFPFR